MADHAVMRCLVFPRNIRRVRLFLEILEDRTLLSLISSFALSKTGDWANPPAQPGDFDPSTILVRFKPGVPASARAGFLQGTTLGREIPLVPGAFAVNLSPGVRVQDALVAYQHNAWVQYAEPNPRVHAALIPNDPLFDLLYGLHNKGQEGGTPGADISATTAWDTSTGSTSVPVADIDTGIDYNHPDLYLNIWINQKEIPVSRRANLTDVDGDGLITFWDLNNPINQGPGKITDINHDGHIDAEDILAPMILDDQGRDTGMGGWAYPGNTQDGDTTHPNDFIGWNFVDNTNRPFDDFGHGTHTAGIIGAIGDNGEGVVGVNWKTQIAALKFLDATGSGSLENAALALSYAVQHQIPISNNSWGAPISFFQSLFDVVAASRDAGHIFVAAAGNWAWDNDVNYFYPANYDVFSNNVVAVAATDHNDELGVFSDFGPARVQLGAPGVHILSTVPTGDCTLCDPAGYAFLDGTSMAAPHVTGTLALVWGLHPDWTYRQVIDQVLINTDPIPSLAQRTSTGGRLNTGAALGPGPAGPRAIRISPADAVLSIRSVQVVFDSSIDPSTFGVKQVDSLTDPFGRSIPVNAVSPVPGKDNKVFDIWFEAQDAIGTYTLVLDPSIADMAGRQLDQNHNGIAGEFPDDQFVTQFHIVDPCGGPDASRHQFCVTPFEDLDIHGQPGTFTILPSFLGSVPVDLGDNNFRFYGNRYSGANALFVSGSGLITFGNSDDSLLNYDLTTLPPEAAIAVLWSTWVQFMGTHAVEGKIDQDRLILQWNDVPHFLPTSPRGVTFQAILQLNTGTEDGDITLNFVNLDTGDENAQGATATVGIKAAGTQGANRLLTSINNLCPFVHSRGAIRFSAVPLRNGTHSVWSGLITSLTLTSGKSNPSQLPENSWNSIDRSDSSGTDWIEISRSKWLWDHAIKPRDSTGVSDEELEWHSPDFKALAPGPIEID